MDYVCVHLKTENCRSGTFLTLDLGVRSPFCQETDDEKTLSIPRHRDGAWDHRRQSYTYFDTFRLDNRTFISSQYTPANRGTGSGYGFRHVWVQGVRRNSLDLYDFQSGKIYAPNVGGAYDVKVRHKRTFYKSTFTWIRQVWSQKNSQLSSIKIIGI